jgi:hypothetical protein
MQSSLLCLGLMTLGLMMLPADAVAVLGYISIPTLGLLAYQNRILWLALQKNNLAEEAPPQQRSSTAPAASATLIELSVHQPPAPAAEHSEETADPLSGLRVNLLQGASWTPLQIIDMSTSGARAHASVTLKTRQSQRAHLLVTIPGHEPQVIAATVRGEGRDSSTLLGLSFVPEHTEDFDTFAAALRAFLRGEALRMAV